MIGQIGPLVQEGSNRKQLLGAHILGGAFGAMVAGVLLGTAGVLLAVMVPSVHQVLLTIALPIACIYLGAADLRIVGTCQLLPRRQTARAWGCALGELGASAAWGADLGAQVTTRAAFQSALLVPIFALAAGALMPALAITALHGVARSVGVAATLLVARDRWALAGESLTLSYPQFRRFIGGTAIVLGSLLLLVSPSSLALLHLLLGGR